MQSNNWELRTDNFTLGSAAMASDASVFPGALVSHSTDWRSSYSRCDVYIYMRYMCIYLCVYIHMRYRYILTNPHGLKKCSVLTLGYLTKSHDPCHHLVRPRIGPMQSNNISQRDSIQYQSMLYLLYNIILYRSISTCECQVDLPKHLMILFFTQDLSQLTHDIEPALAAIDP